MSGGLIERRTAVRRLAWAALFPFFALGLPSRGVGAARRAVEVPRGAYRLERILTRELAGGGAIVVTRRWQIAFAGSAEGMVVSGVQTFAGVAAPPALAPLAALERARSPEVFPLTLDEAGLILRTARGSDGSALARALESGRALVQSLPAVAAGREDVRRFMAQLTDLGAEAVSRLPRDLFFPQPGRDTTTRNIILPGGETGSIAIVASASAAAGSGLLVASERRIVTRIEGGERQGGERWTLDQT